MAIVLSREYDNLSSCIVVQYHFSYALLLVEIAQYYLKLLNFTWNSSLEYTLFIRMIWYYADG